MGRAKDIWRRVIVKSPFRPLHQLSRLPCVKRGDSQTNYNLAARVAHASAAPNGVGSPNGPSGDVAQAGADGRQVVAVSSTSQREGCVLLDGNGSELYAGPNRDLRAQVEGDQLAQAHGDEIYTRTGHFPSGMFPAARLKWFQRHQPELYRQASRLLMINDWVLYRLSGVCASEPTNAAETCMFDLGKGSWANDLIEQLGLRRVLFADVVTAGTRIGAVSRLAAQATGLATGTPVVVGGADTQCGVLGSGAIDSGDMAVVAGTTTPLQLVLASLVIDPGGRMWSGPFLSADRFVLESNAGGAGTVYRWCLDNLWPAGDATVQKALLA